MKKRIFLMSAVVAACILLTACTNLVRLSLDGGKLIDKANGITYVGAPVCFEPIRIEEEPYAKCSALKIELYEIVGLPVTEWISEPYDGIGAVYYAEDVVTLPTLAEFEASSIMVCVEQTITTALGQVSDAADVAAVVGAFVNGEPTSIVQEGTSYKLKIASEKYEGLYYSLIYVEGNDGENYIYDRSTQTCVNVGDVLLKYLPRETVK